MFQIPNWVLFVLPAIYPCIHIHSYHFNWHLSILLMFTSIFPDFPLNLNTYVFTYYPEMPHPQSIKNRIQYPLVSFLFLSLSKGRYEIHSGFQNSKSGVILNFCFPISLYTYNYMLCLLYFLCLFSSDISPLPYLIRSSDFVSLFSTYDPHFGQH